MRKKIITRMQDVLYAVRENNEVSFFEEHPRITPDGWDGHVVLEAKGGNYDELYDGEVYMVTLTFELNSVNV